jgi:hypothetical protein
MEFGAKKKFDTDRALLGSVDALFKSSGGSAR